MAVFGAGLPEGQTQEFLSYSRGIGDDKTGQYLGNAAEATGKASGIALTAAGDTLGKAAVAADTYVKNSIFDEATKQVDRVRNEYGVDAATKVSAGTGGDVPALQEAKKKLSSLQSGYMSGALKESYYGGQLQSIVKNLKASYPGYEKEIDDTVQSITGITPANFIVSALRQEAAQAASKASQEDNFQRSFLASHTDVLHAIYPNYETMANKPSFAQLSQAIGQVEAHKYVALSRSADLSLALAEDKATVTDATNVMHQNVNGIASISTVGVVSQWGNTNNEIQQKISSLLQPGAPPPSPEEVTAMTKSLDGQILSVTQAVRAEQMKPEFALVSKQDKDDALANALGPLSAMKEALTNEQLGLFGLNARALAYSKNQAVSQLYASDPIFPYLGALNQEFGQAAVSQALDQKGGALWNTFTQGYDLWLKAKINAGASTSIEATINDLAANPVSKDYIGALLRDTVKAGTTQQNEVLAQRNLTYLFGPQNTDPYKVFTNFKPTDRATVYGNLVNQTVTDKISQFPELKSNYIHFAYTSFKGILDEHVADLKGMKPEYIQTVEARYDEAAGQIVAGPKGGFRLGQKPEDYALPVDTDLAQTQVLRNIHDLNVLLASIQPVIKLEGGDPGKTLKSIIEATGLDKVLNLKESAPKGDKLGDAAVNDPTGDLSMNIPGNDNFNYDRQRTMDTLGIKRPQVPRPANDNKLGVVT